MSINTSFYALSDALQMPISYDGNGVVLGRSRGLVPGLPAPIPVQLTAKAVFLKEQVGILAHVTGDLYVIVAHNPAKGGTSAYLLEGPDLPGGEKFESVIQKNMNLREVVTALRSAIVVSFVLRKGKWQPMNLPSGKDDALQTKDPAPV